RWRFCLIISVSRDLRHRTILRDIASRCPSITGRLAPNNGIPIAGISVFLEYDSRVAFERHTVAACSNELRLECRFASGFVDFAQSWKRWARSSRPVDAVNAAHVTAGIDFDPNRQISAGHVSVWKLRLHEVRFRQQHRLRDRLSDR